MKVGCLKQSAFVNFPPHNPLYLFMVPDNEIPLNPGLFLSLKEIYNYVERSMI